MSQQRNYIDPRYTLNTIERWNKRKCEDNVDCLGTQMSSTYPKNPEKSTLIFKKVTFLRTCCLGKMARRFLALRSTGMAYARRLCYTSTTLFTYVFLEDTFIVYKISRVPAYVVSNQPVYRTPMPISLSMNFTLGKRR